MRAFAHLPSKRRVAGVIAFALMMLSALGAVHHHRLGVASETTTLTGPVESDNTRTADCFVCRTVVSSRVVAPSLSAPHIVVAQCDEVSATEPVLADVFAPAAPRAPPAA